MMALPSSPLSIDIKCGNFPSGTLSSDVAKLLVDYFVAATGHKIVAVQEFPGKIARVTFEIGGEAHKIRFLREGEITVNGVKCTIIRPAPPPPSYTNVVVFQFPFEASNTVLAKELSAFGEVKDVRFQTWTNIPGVSTGTRIVRMIRTKPIPRFVSIQGVRVKVWFKGQLVICDICRKVGHRAGSCPDKGKCLRCHQSGHFATNCRRPWGNHSGPPPPAAGSSVPAGGSSAPAAEVHPHTGNGEPPLIFADELDKGFEPFNGDRDLADAAAVAEAFLNEGSESSGIVIACDLVIDEDGDAPPVTFEGVSPPIVLDDRDNQLDEIASQDSVSILANCGPDAASSGGELSDSQISNVSNVDNLSTNNEVENNGDNVVNNVSNSSVHGNVNCYGSEIAPDDASSGSVGLSSSVKDSEMPQASGPNKRPISEVSSDESADSSSSSASSSIPVPVAKSANKRITKKAVTSGHVPNSVASVARMAVARVSSIRK